MSPAAAALGSGLGGSAERAGADLCRLGQSVTRLFGMRHGRTLRHPSRRDGSRECRPSLWTRDV
jgi:hypothetical protein